MTRGERLKNPLNLRISDNAWQGKITPPQDQSYEQFDTTEHGLRAGAKLLLTYFHKYGLNTVDGIISRFAPSNENDTKSYIADVCSRMGVSPNDSLVLSDVTTLTNLVNAIVWHENGENTYSRSLVFQACEGALL